MSRGHVAVPGGHALKAPASGRGLAVSGYRQVGPQVAQAHFSVVSLTQMYGVLSLL